MNWTLRPLTRVLRFAFGRGNGADEAAASASASASAPIRMRPTAGQRRTLITLAAACGFAVVVCLHPPIQSVAHGDVAVRTNQLTGSMSRHDEGGVWVLPVLHELRRFNLRDQVYHPAGNDDAPFQSVEGLSFGMDVAVRYALDPTHLGSIARQLPDDIAGQVVQPAVQGVLYKTFARYTVREVFSTKRAEIQASLEQELKTKLAADGIVLKGVDVGKVALPADYKKGMDKLLAEELETAKMRYTLELKEKRVQETALDGEADRVRREKAAQAAANEQLIAARGQEEAMKHVLPFKQKQIEQRQLEAEAEKVARIKTAEGAAQARRVEASGEADSRQKLADAEAYRLQRVGLANSEQMAREGALITKHPSLIQKAMADKLSDKISVIIAPPSVSGGFIGAGLLGNNTTTAAVAQDNSAMNKEGQ